MLISILFLSIIFSLYFAFMKINSFCKAILSISLIIFLIEFKEYGLPFNFLNIVLNDKKFSFE